MPVDPLITPPLRLHIRQQPVHARQCGFGTKDFRPIDPVPIIQMVPVVELKASHNYIVCASLLSGDGTQEVDQVIVPPKSGSRLVDPYLRNLESDGFGPSHVKVLVGTLVSSAQIYEDLTKETGLFFIFHDLSIRTLGEFRLKFELFDVSNDKSIAITSSVSLPIQVYTAKDYPGMLETPPLVRCLANQGAKLVIREVQHRQRYLQSTKSPGNGDGEDLSTFQGSSSPMRANQEES